MAWDDDFGYFGDGSDGYAHYMTAFDRNFGDSDFEDAEYDEYGDPIDTDTIYADAGSCENGGTYEQPVIFAPVQIGPQRKDYPNERSYDAAVYLDQLEKGMAYIGTDETAESMRELCEFILHGEAVAAKYLTYNRYFLYAQAVKENFDLPITMPDEDTSPKTDLHDLLVELADEDAAFAAKIWYWCVKTFAPYMKYADGDWQLRNQILYETQRYPQEFMDHVTTLLATDEVFRKELLTDNSEFPANMGSYVLCALRKGHADYAKIIFRAAMDNPRAKGTDKEDFIRETIEHCKDWNDLTSMEVFQKELLPLIEARQEKRIRRLLPEFRKEIREYIEYVEQNSVKYRYSRKNAWRKTCKDGSAYGLDPLDYDTEQEYNSELHERMYGWRRWMASIAQEYGINPEDFETRAEFDVVLHEAQVKKYEQQKLEWKAKRARQAEERRAQKQAEIKADPLADTDKTAYLFCGVVFPSTDTVYHYRTDDETLAVGDLVIVPQGKDNREVTAEIVMIGKYLRKYAPYAVDKAKFVKSKKEQEDRTDV